MQLFYIWLRTWKCILDWAEKPEKHCLLNLLICVCLFVFNWDSHRHSNLASITSYFPTSVSLWVLLICVVLLIQSLPLLVFQQLHFSFTVMHWLFSLLRPCSFHLRFYVSFFLSFPPKFFNLPFFCFPGSLLPALQILLIYYWRKWMTNKGLE